MPTYDKAAADIYFSGSSYTGQDLINHGFTLGSDADDQGAAETYYGGGSPPTSFYPSTMQTGEPASFPSEPSDGGLRIPTDLLPQPVQTAHEYGFRPGTGYSLGGETLEIANTGLGPASPVEVISDNTILGSWNPTITRSDFDLGTSDLPIPDISPMIYTQDPTHSSPGGYIPMPGPLVLPALGTALKVASTITVAGAQAGGSRVPSSISGIFGGNLLHKGLAVLGLVTVAGEITDWGQILWPDFSTDEQQRLQELVSEMVASGFIQTPAPRRDGTVSPMTWLHWNLEDPDSRPFLTGEYISRKFVSAVRRNERTPRFRGRPRPFRRTRR